MCLKPGGRGRLFELAAVPSVFLVLLSDHLINEWLQIWYILHEKSQNQHLVACDWNRVVKRSAYLFWLQPLGFGQNRLVGAERGRSGDSELTLLVDVLWQTSDGVLRVVVLLQQVISQQTWTNRHCGELPAFSGFNVSHQAYRICSTWTTWTWSCCSWSLQKWQFQCYRYFINR